MAKIKNPVTVELDHDDCLWALAAWARDKTDLPMACSAHVDVKAAAGKLSAVVTLAPTRKG